MYKTWIMHSATSDNPFYNDTFVRHGGVDYLMGALCILLALLSAFYIRNSKRKMEEYKKQQLEEYNKNHNKNVKDYNSTGMYLPMKQRFFYGLPITLVVLFGILAISFFAATPIQSL